MEAVRLRLLLGAVRSPQRATMAIPATCYLLPTTTTDCLLPTTTSTYYLLAATPGAASSRSCRGRRCSRSRPRWSGCPRPCTALPSWPTSTRGRWWGRRWPPCAHHAHAHAHAHTRAHAHAHAHAHVHANAHAHAHAHAHAVHVPQGQAAVLAVVTLANCSAHRVLQPGLGVSHPAHHA